MKELIKIFSQTQLRKTKNMTIEQPEIRLAITKLRPNLECYFW